MRKARAIVPWVLWVAAVSAGCQKWEWWKNPDSGPSQSAAKDPNRELKPGELAALRSENAILHEQLQEMKIREGQLSKDVAELRFLCNQQIKQIQTLAEAPVERDRARSQVEELKAENERLREELRRLSGGAGPAASQPAVQPLTRPSSVPLRD